MPRKSNLTNNNITEKTLENINLETDIGGINTEENLQAI
jgi:hypothetical protein